MPKRLQSLQAISHETNLSCLVEAQYIKDSRGMCVARKQATNQGLWSCENNAEVRGGQFDHQRE